jgi:flagellar assembly protein FliH
MTDQEERRRRATDKRDDLERIPADRQTAYERWEMPVIGEAGQMADRRAPVAPLKPPTAADLEAIREAAYQEGLEQGFEEGRKKGYESGFKGGYEKGKQQGLTDGTASGRTEIMAALSKQIESGFQRIDQVTQLLSDPVAELADEIEQASVDMIIAISRCVVSRELMLDSSHIADIVRQALVQMPESDRPLSIALNPGDLEFLETHARPRPSWFQYCVMDEAMAPGGCRLDNRLTLVDFTADKRFMQVVSDMLNKVQPAGAEDEEDDDQAEDSDRADD